MKILDLVGLFIRYKSSGLRQRWGYQRARLQHALDARSAGEGLLFLTGFYKSGTTWLRLMLNDHPEISCYGEGKLMNYFQQGMRFLDSSGGYSVLIETLLESPWYKAAGNIWLSPEGIESFVRETLQTSMLSFRDSDQVSLVGDKSTVQDCFLIRKIFPKAYIVTIVRDGRDVAVSFAYHMKRRGDANVFQSNGRFDLKYLQEVAKAWAVYNDHIHSFAKTNDEKFSLIKYEDLLTDPNPILQRLYEFLHVQSNASLVAKISAHNNFEVLSRGRNPGQENERSFYRKGVAGDWKNYFGDEENSIFETLAGKVMRSFGYA